MNDEECIARYDLLVKTIVDEAKAKKQEELVLANEECEDERRKILESGQRKMDLEYEKKEKQVELAIKILQSNLQNESKLQKLRVQQEQLGNAFNEARKRLKQITERPDYPQLLHQLVVQALVHIDEKQVSLMTRAEDSELVQKILPDALKEYKEKWARGESKSCKVKVETKKFLKCSGGVLLSGRDGKIYCNNTLDIRLVYAYESSLPNIREIVTKDTAHIFQ